MDLWFYFVGFKFCIIDGFGWFGWVCLLFVGRYLLGFMVVFVILWLVVLIVYLLVCG